MLLVTSCMIINARRHMDHTGHGDTKTPSNPQNHRRVILELILSDQDCSQWIIQKPCGSCWSYRELLGCPGVRVMINCVCLCFKKYDPKSPKLTLEINVVEVFRSRDQSKNLVDVVFAMRSFSLWDDLRPEVSCFYKFSITKLVYRPNK